VTDASAHGEVIPRADIASALKQTLMVDTLSVIVAFWNPFARRSGSPFSTTWALVRTYP
jgi:hypothetical protein